ncbi:conserved hypothetical protein [Trichinella spiralis]|uniref:hypothetical protein n=1 Tax=Trichinella spiralis TaxID=6334 RepID=UPI0001EFD6C4|nr:conserved hypothetical protein [Trichinella spiralis]
MIWQIMPPLAQILPHIFHRGTRPKTQCTTAVQYRDTHNFWPGDRICGSLLSKHQQNPFLRLIIDVQGKTESVVQQMDDDYTRETGFVRSSAAYGFPGVTCS